MPYWPMKTPISMRLPSTCLTLAQLKAADFDTVRSSMRIRPPPASM